MWPFRDISKDIFVFVTLHKKKEFNFLNMRYGAYTDYVLTLSYINIFICIQ